MNVPQLGLGCAQLGNLFRKLTEDEAYAVLEAAWDTGIRHFDTAPHYGLGLSERRLGLFLASRPRDEFVLSTKVGRLLRPDPSWDGEARDGDFDVPAGLRRKWDFSPASVRASLEESLGRLGLDRVDILYSHDPEHSGIAGAVQQGLESLATLREAGLVSMIGTGSMTAETLGASASTGLADLVMVAGRYTLLDQSVVPDVLAACDRHGTKIVAAAVFNSGLLASTLEPGARFDYAEVSNDVLARAVRINDVCRSHGVALPTAALHYPIQDPRVCSVVVGADHPKHVRDTAARLNESVPGALWSDLAEQGLVPPCA